MSLDYLFSNVSTCDNDPHPWWASVLTGDDPFAAFDAFASEALHRFRRIDDACLAEVRSFLEAWAAHFNVPTPRLFVHRRSGSMQVGSVDEDFFLRVVGRMPVDDDLHRVNCDEEGTVGHLACGWCSRCELPRFECGHLAPLHSAGSKP